MTEQLNWTELIFLSVVHLFFVSLVLYSYFYFIIWSHKNFKQHQSTWYVKNSSTHLLPLLSPGTTDIKVLVTVMPFLYKCIHRERKKNAHIFLVFYVFKTTTIFQVSDIFILFAFSQLMIHIVHISISGQCMFIYFLLKFWRDYVERACLF